MTGVLIVDEIASSREELARALDAEGFRVVQSASASDAVRDIWEGTYIVVFIASVLSETDPQSLAQQLTDTLRRISLEVAQDSPLKDLADRMQTWLDAAPVGAPALVPPFAFDIR